MLRERERVSLSLAFYPLSSKGNFFSPYIKNCKLNLEVVRHPLFEVPYSHLKRGQQTLGALVAVVRSNRYINIYLDFFTLYFLVELEGGPTCFLYYVP